MTERVPAWGWAGFAVGLTLVALAATLDDAPTSMMLAAGLFLLVATTTAVLARVLTGGKSD